MVLPDGRHTATPLLPLMLDGKRLGLRLDPPKLGEHGRELLLSLNYSDSEIADLVGAGVVLAPH